MTKEIKYGWINWKCLFYQFRNIFVLLAEFTNVHLISFWREMLREAGKRFPNCFRPQSTIIRSLPGKCPLSLCRMKCNLNQLRRYSAKGDFHLVVLQFSCLSSAQAKTCQRFCLSWAWKILSSAQAHLVKGSAFLEHEWYCLQPKNILSKVPLVLSMNNIAGAFALRYSHPLNPQSLEPAIRPSCLRS